MTFVTHRECSRCGKRREPGRVHNLCECGGPLPVRYDLGKARRFLAVCLTCHDQDMIRQQRITRTQWSREIDKMMRWGAPAKPEDREAILDYLNNYGPRLR